MKEVNGSSAIPDDRVERTIATYDTIAERYHLANTRERRGRKQHSMSVFLSMLNVKRVPSFQPRVLVVACGLGDDAVYLAEHKTQVTAFDLSPEMLKRAKQADPNGDYRLLDLRDMDKLEGRFDGVWARGCLYHLTPEELAKWFGACHRGMQAGGVLYFSLKEGKGEEMRSVPATGYSGGEIAIRSLQGERYYAYYSPEEVEAMFEQYFTIEKFERMVSDQPAFEFWLKAR